MKKIICMILAVLMLASLGSGAFAAEPPDEAAVAELCHRLFTANQPEDVFTRHKSMSVTLLYPEDPNNDYFVWQTPDCSYQEWGTGMAHYLRDRVYYWMNHDAETDSFEQQFGVDARAAYDGVFRITGADEEEFYQPEHEKFTDFHTEDGMTYTRSRLDEELSRQWIEEYLGADHPGQTVITETISDAETDELQKLTTIIVQDGKETVLYTASIAYDTPEPMASLNLRAGFERSADETMTINFVVDPGTDHEIRRTLTVPVNMDAGHITDTPFAIFDDPQGETLTHWDRQHDVDYYLFTNPSDEMLERYNTLLDQIKAEREAQQ